MMSDKSADKSGMTLDRVESILGEAKAMSERVGLLSDEVDEISQKKQVACDETRAVLEEIAVEARSLSERAKSMSYGFSDVG